jgi:hypothetical protein
VQQKVNTTKPGMILKQLIGKIESQPSNQKQQLKPKCIATFGTK